MRSDGVPVDVGEAIVEGLRIHARVALDAAPAGAPTAVLVHGIGVSGSYLEPLMRTLGDRVRLHAPDLPGFGHSQSPDRLLGLASLAGSVLGYLDARRIERAALVGNSFGCQIAIQAAWMRPERISRVVLQGPTIDAAARSWHGQIPRWLSLGPFERATLPFVVIRDYLRAGTLRTARTTSVAIADRPEDKVGDLRQPVLLVRGRRDLTVSERWVRELAELAPDGRVVEVPKASHTMTYSHPALLADAIAPFLLADVEGSDR